MNEVKTLRKLAVGHKGLRPVSAMPNWNIEDLESAGLDAMPYPGTLRDSINRIIVREAILVARDPDWLMEKLYYIAAPGAQLVIDCPFGSHDRAEEWHFKRKMFADTMRKYEPKWSFDRRTFFCDGLFFPPNLDPEQIAIAVSNSRNVCKGIACEFSAQKPVPEGYKPADPVSLFKMI